MLDDNPLSVNVEAEPLVAADEPTNGVDNSVSEATAEVVADDKTQASPEKTETQELPDDPKIPQNFRDQMKSLNADIKDKYKPVYTGLEKVSTDLFGSTAPEDIQAAIQTVQALAPTIKVVTDPSSSQADVISAIQKLLPAEHVEGIAWAALNDPATQAVIFDDPEVLQAISERLFDGRSIDEINALLANAPAETDPRVAELIRKDKERTALDAKKVSDDATKVAQDQSNQLMTWFFEAPAQTVIADDFKLVAPEGASEADKLLFSETAKDIRFAAQGRFLEQNMDAYMQIDNLYRQGKTVQAQAAEIRLANRYHATLIKTAERHSNLLKSRSDAAVNDQQERINGVRPDMKGSVEQGEQKSAPVWDFDRPDAENVAAFSRSFHN